MKLYRVTRRESARQATKAHLNSPYCLIIYGNVVKYPSISRLSDVCASRNLGRFLFFPAPNDRWLYSMQGE
jgi:hypothetical protein